MLLTQNPYLHVLVLSLENGKGYEVERILIHDGISVITSFRWFNESMSNHYPKHGGYNIEALPTPKKKNTVDLSIELFYTKTTCEYASNSGAIDLYINIDLLECSYIDIVSYQSLVRIYKSALDEQIYFEQTLKDYNLKVRNIEQALYSEKKIIADNPATSYDILLSAKKIIKLFEDLKTEKDLMNKEIETAKSIYTKKEF